MLIVPLEGVLHSFAYGMRRLQLYRVVPPQETRVSDLHAHGRRGGSLVAGRHATREEAW